MSQPCQIAKFSSIFISVVKKGLGGRIVGLEVTPSHILYAEVALQFLMTNQWPRSISHFPIRPQNHQK